jgi:hypothetical protein
MRKTVENPLCLYLPTKLRRWYVLGPACLLIVSVLLVSAILVGACFIRSDAFFQAGPLPQDARMQLNHIGDAIRKANRTGRLEIYEGYSSFSGVHAEWIPIFYTFSSMALSEIHKAYPEQRDEAASLLTMCARGVLRVPPEVPDEGIPRFLENRKSTESPLMAGYMGVVLGLRKAIVKDTLFDAAMGPLVELLVPHIESCCEHCTSEWTADQATQLYTIWLYDRAFGTDHSGLFDRWQRLMRERFLEKGTGLHYSLISVNPDARLSEPRATSIAWTSIFLADVMPQFAREQYAALCRYRQRRFFSLAATAEYSRGRVFEFGDLDSGPLFLGISPAATGFTLCTHKLYDSPASFTRIYRVLELLGSPRESGDRKSYRRGNAMGDAILLYAKVALPRK